MKDLRDRLSDIPERLRLLSKVARQSGLLWELTVPGLKTVFTSLRSGSQTPSLVYRIHAANSPKKTALFWRDRKVSFQELDERMDRVASGFAKRGIGKGASVIVMMRNRPEFVEIQGGASRLGAAAVSVSWRSTPSELVYLATHCGAKAICFEADLAPTVEAAKKELPHLSADMIFSVGGDVPGFRKYDDLVSSERLTSFDVRAQNEAAVVIYTSGTTGKPKGAVRKFPKEAMAAALKFIGETPMRADDVHLVACPLYHSTAFGFMSLSGILGASCVLMDDFKPEAFLQHVDRYDVTTTAVVPTMLHRVLALGKDTLKRYDSRSLRAIFSGGAPLPGPLAIEVMDHFGDILFNFYGATETGLVTLAKPADLRAAPGTIGRPVPGNQIRLLDEEGREVEGGNVGELYARNKLLVAGYHRDDESTQKSMRDGFFSVGDLARKDRDGRFFIEGRKRDMVISGGVNVYPAEVESVLEAHPALGEVAVIGVPDPEFGERVRAFVAKRPGHDVDEGALKVWCRERLAGPKVPRDFVFLEALPRNPTGKVLKRELRELG